MTTHVALLTHPSAASVIRPPELSRTSKAWPISASKVAKASVEKSKRANVKAHAERRTQHMEHVEELWNIPRNSWNDARNNANSQKACASSKQDAAGKYFGYLLST